MRSSHLFSDRAALIQALLWGCSIAGVLCLMSGALITVATLEHSLLLGACLGVALLLGGVFLMELDRWHEEKNGNRGEPGSSTVGQNHAPKVAEEVIEAAAMQAVIVLLFGLLLDNGVRLTACLYSCLGYWTGALIVFVRRRNALTRGDRLYLRWGWLPILVISTVLFLRVWKSKGLI